MDRESLFASMVRWNYWGSKPLPRLKSRDILSSILKFESENHPIVLTGVRRSGKSSLLLLIMSELLNRGVDRNQFLFLNFEEPQFSGHLSPVFLDELVALYRERVNPDKKIYFFLDEIQNLPDWQRWVRREADLKEHKIFLTGSSAKLMSGEISTLLTGRYFVFSIFPLSFREILSWKNIPFKTEVEYAENKARIQSQLREYLYLGGFPEVLLTEDEEKQKRILLQYFNDILYRDIVYRHQIRDVRLLEAVASFYITNISSLHSFNRIRNLFNTSIDNIRRYSAFLEESYLIFLLKKFSFKMGEQQKSNRKVYAIDCGLRNQVGFRFSSDLGKLAENAVFLHILRKSDRIFYYLHRGECDFIYQSESRFRAVQVCMNNLEERRVKERELKGLLTALEHLNEKEGIIVTENLEMEETVNGKIIHFIPLWKYLLFN